ncbi:MAG: hypothetical protein ACFFDW_07215 [Candidatus Thorarchaeota archaeon]
MNKKSTRLFALFIISAFLLTSIIFQANGKTNTNPIFGIEGSDTYFEDFTTDTYKDALTDAWGWNTGTLTGTRNFTLQVLDFYGTSNPIKAVEVQGRKAYVSTFSEVSTLDTLQIFNINNPNHIKLIETRDSSSFIYSLAVDGDVLYAGINGGSDRINVYNVTFPFEFDQPYVYLDSAYSDGCVSDIEPYGHLVYYTAFQDTSSRAFRIFDAENPSDLREIIPNWEITSALGLDVVGHFAYIAASTEGLYIMNVTDKFTPVQVGYVDTPGNATDVLVDGGLAFVADGDAGITIIDVQDPTSPTILGHYNTPGNAYRVELQGRTLFVADGIGGIQVLDVADPNNPAFVTEIAPLPYTWDIELFGGYVVAATNNGLYTFKICAGTGIGNIAYDVYANTFDMYHAYDVRVQGDIAYVAAGGDGFYTLNVRDPSNPILLDYWNSSGLILRKIDLQGQFAYCVGTGSVHVFDVTDPTNIQLCRYLMGNQLRDVCVAGEVVYISWMLGGYAVINGSSPFNFDWSLEFDEPHFGSNITALDVQGPHVYTVDASNAITPNFRVFQQLDLTDQTFTDDSISFWGYCYDIYVDGDLAFISDRDWLVVFNVTDPYNIDYLGDADITIAAGYVDSLGVWGFGPYILSASPTDGVAMINATALDPYDYNGWFYPNATGALQVYTHGDYTYIANTTNLIILRHFKSAGDTYIPDAYIAQSTNFNSLSGNTIRYATLYVNDYVPLGTNIEYYLSADGGAHWELVTPGVELTFATPGEDLRWKAEFTSQEDRSVHISSVEITYETSKPPGITTLNSLDDSNFLGLVSLTWEAASDDVAVDHYEVQVCDSMTFGDLFKEYTTSSLKQSVYGLAINTYYFRVRAVDGEGQTGPWSNVVNTDVTFNLLGPMWLGIIGGGLVLIILIIVVIAVVIRKKKKTPTR